MNGSVEKLLEVRSAEASIALYRAQDEMLRAETSTLSAQFTSLRHCWRKMSVVKPAQRDFFELVKAIGESKSKQEEDRIIADEVRMAERCLFAAASTMRNISLISSSRGTIRSCI
jgi:hypothetical protein